MTIEQLDVVDFILVEPDGDTILTVSDHLTWDDASSTFCACRKS